MWISNSSKKAKAKIGAGTGGFAPFCVWARGGFGFCAAGLGKVFDAARKSLLQTFRYMIFVNHRDAGLSEKGAGHAIAGNEGSRESSVVDEPRAAAWAFRLKNCQFAPFA